MNPRTTIALLAACLGFAAFDARSEVVVGVHVGSQHFPNKEYHSNVNPGIYVRSGQWQAGYFRNSYKRDAFYAGYVQPIGRVDLMVGLSTGYQRVCTTYQAKVGERWEVEQTDAGVVKQKVGVFEDRQSCQGFGRHSVTPLAALSYAAPFKVLGATPRLYFMPGMARASSVLHFSLEYR